jgi:SAM-dependent methyltransferase
MKEYDISTYGNRVAPVYDELYAVYDPAMIATLAKFASGGRALELGIGTGRIALPLAEQGIEVTGIDSSPSMVERLRAKPGGKNIPVTIGNFADVGVEGEYKLIFVVFSTFFGLLTQEEQVRCFEGVARHLSADGSFVLEAFVPDLTRYSSLQAVRAAQITSEKVNLDVASLDPVTQQVTGQHVIFTDKGVKLYPIRIRYVWPSEMDLMARLAGLRLRHRWGGWSGEPFTAKSEKHVSVYEACQ